MAANQETVVDWLACCGCENEAPKFVKRGIDSINKLRDLEEGQFRKIGLSSWMYDNFCKLQGWTRTGEELSQEVLVSILSMSKYSVKASKS